MPGCWLPWPENMKTRRPVWSSRLVMSAGWVRPAARSSSAAVKSWVVVATIAARWRKWVRVVAREYATFTGWPPAPGVQRTGGVVGEGKGKCGGVDNSELRVAARLAAWARRAASVFADRTHGTTASSGVV